MRNYKKVTKCRCCFRMNLVRFLSLGKLPLANSYVNFNDVNKIQKTYPLSICFCKDCGMVQLEHVIDPNIMFKNYLYVPSTSPAHIRHFQNLVKSVVEKFKTPVGSMVIDIGSNDGSLLTEFRKYRKMETLGVDPAKNLALIARKRGINTVNDYFSSILAKRIKKKIGQTDIITSTNTVGHIDNIHDLFEGVRILLSKKGVFVAEFPYLVDLLGGTLFDTIYHEHLSYFSVRPLVKVLKKQGLELVDVERLQDIDGGALRVYIQKSGDAKVIGESVSDLLALEAKMKLTKRTTYSAFNSRVTRLKSKLTKLVKSLGQNSKTVAGYGATAKGNILLNYFNLSRNDIVFIADKNPMKQGLFTSGSRIPIVDPKIIMDVKPDYLLLLAWNYKDEIMLEQSQFKKNGGKFILPFPQVQII